MLEQHRGHVPERPPKPQSVDRYSVDWFRLAFADIKDNIPFAKPAPEARIECAPNQKIAEKVFSEHERRILSDMVRELPQGVEHEITIIVGSSERGTAHPHRFVLKNTGTAAEIFFLDPEDYVGVRPAQMKPRISLAYVQDVLRPRIVNLLAARIPFDETALPTVVSLRYRSELLAKQSDDIDRLDFQLAVAKDALEHQGLPELLANVPQEIVTRIALEPGRAVVQDRHSKQEEVRAFVETGSGSPILEARLLASQQVFRRLVGAAKERSPRVLVQ